VLEALPHEHNIRIERVCEVIYHFQHRFTVWLCTIHWLGFTYRGIAALDSSPYNIFNLSKEAPGKTPNK